MRLPLRTPVLLVTALTVAARLEAALELSPKGDTLLFRDAGGEVYHVEQRFAQDVYLLRPDTPEGLVFGERLLAQVDRQGHSFAWKQPLEEASAGAWAGDNALLVRTERNGTVTSHLFLRDPNGVWQPRELPPGTLPEAGWAPFDNGILIGRKKEGRVDAVFRVDAEGRSDLVFRRPPFATDPLIFPNGQIAYRAGMLGLFRDYIHDVPTGRTHRLPRGVEFVSPGTTTRALAKRSEDGVERHFFIDPTTGTETPLPPGVRLWGGVEHIIRRGVSPDYTQVYDDALRPLTDKPGAYGFEVRHLPPYTLVYVYVRDTNQLRIFNLAAQWDLTLAVDRLKYKRDGFLWLKNPDGTIQILDLAQETPTPILSEKRRSRKDATPPEKVGR